MRYQSVALYSFMACGRPQGTFDNTSYDLPDPLNKPVIGL
jgi:hypothetical protein